MRLGVQIGILADEWTDQGATGEEQPCDRAIAIAGQSGARGLEVFERHALAYRNRPEALRELLLQHEVALSGVYFPLTIDPASAAEGRIAEAAVLAEIMREVRGEFIVLNGGPRFEGDRPEYSHAEFQRLAQTANEIGKRAADHGVAVVMHPHLRSMVETNEHLEKLLDAGLSSDLVGLCVHASHQMLAGADPYVMYERHADIIRYVHIGNSQVKNGKNQGTFVDTGDLDQDRLTNAIMSAGYDGWIVIECTTPGATTADYVEHTRNYFANRHPEVSFEDGEESSDGSKS